MPSDKAGAGNREVFIEIVTLGAYAKATAIDAATGTEVSIVGPCNAERAVLERAAVNKLNFILKKADPPG